MVRIILAGVLGGIVMFMSGAFEHMALNWGGRTIKVLADDKAARDFFAAQKASHGVYAFPSAGAHATEAELNELYKQGNGIIFIGRIGEDMMSPFQLGMEAASNVVVALLAAFIVSRLRVGAGFGLRWLVVVLIGIAGWFSIAASHAIWYRFHWDFVRDELLCATLESALAGLLIAWLVKPAEQNATAPPTS